MKKAIISLIVLTLVVVSCKKTSSERGETFSANLIADNVVVDTLSVYDQKSSVEAGQKFFVSKNGNTKKLGCMMGSKGKFKASLWDFDTKSLITSATVTVSDTIHFFYSSIAAINITANKRYVISVNNTDATGSYKLIYKGAKKPGSSFIKLPFITGKFTVEETLAALSATSVFPELISTHYLWGMPDMEIEFSE